MCSRSIHQPSQQKPLVNIDVYAPNSIAIDFDAFSPIADDPLYVDTARRRHVRPLTFSELLNEQICDTPTRLWLDIGWWQRLAGMLEVRGYHVVVNVVQEVEALGLSRQHRPVQANKYSSFLRRIHKRVCSLAVVPSPADRCEILGDLCRQFPDAHLLVVARNSKESVEVARMLSQRIGRRFTFGNDAPSDCPRMHVDSLTGFSQGTSADWTFLVFWDAELILSRTACDQIEAMLGSIRIGFLNCDERLMNERDRAIIEGKFGPVIYRPGDVQGGTDVAVAWITASGYPNKPASRFDRKRSLVWQNAPRNQCIAEVARALSSGDQNRIAGLGLLDAAAWLRVSDTLPDLGVVVVVESMEHGRALAELLPGWRLASANPAVDSSEGDFLPCGNAIATFACANQGIVAGNVIIYAAGYGGRWINQLGSQWRSIQGDRMLAIDVDDLANSDIHADVIQRATDYGRRGWTQFFTTTSESAEPTRRPRRGKRRQDSRGGTTGGPCPPTADVTAPASRQAETDSP